jgi:hypothetical protein
LTTHFAINYGAVLQAFALKKAIEDMGFSCEIIDYRPEISVSGRKIVYSFESIKDIIKSIYMYVNIHNRKVFKEKIKIFDTFLINYCGISKEKYISKNELEKGINKYNTLICGSDQIWNLNLIKDDSYFLNFSINIPDQKKIAYAPSIAEELTKDQYKEIYQKICNFDAISMREGSSCKKYFEVNNEKVENVLDPVFLIEKEEWKRFAKPVNIKKPYILVYSVAGDLEFKKMVKSLKKESNCQLICINTNVYNAYNSDILLNNVSPNQFVWLINNAKEVYTSSYHALLFSIIFNKPCSLKYNKIRSSRHNDILKLLNIKYDINNVDDNITYLYINEEYIKDCQEKLNKEITKSKEFLRKAISSKK